MSGLLSPWSRARAQKYKPHTKYHLGFSWGKQVSERLKWGCEITQLSLGLPLLLQRAIVGSVLLTLGQ